MLTGFGLDCDIDPSRLLNRPDVDTGLSLGAATQPHTEADQECRTDIWLAEHAPTPTVLPWTQCRRFHEGIHKRPLYAHHTVSASLRPESWVYLGQALHSYQTLRGREALGP